MLSILNGVSPAALAASAVDNMRVQSQARTTSSNVIGPILDSLHTGVAALQELAKCSEPGVAEMAGGVADICRRMQLRPEMRTSPPSKDWRAWEGRQNDLLSAEFLARQTLDVIQHGLTAPVSVALAAIGEKLNARYDTQAADLLFEAMRTATHREGNVAQEAVVDVAARGGKRHYDGWLHRNVQKVTYDKVRRGISGSAGFHVADLGVRTDGANFEAVEYLREHTIGIPLDPEKANTNRPAAWADFFKDDQYSHWCAKMHVVLCDARHTLERHPDRG